MACRIIIASFAGAIFLVGSVYPATGADTLQLTKEPSVPTKKLPIKGEVFGIQGRTAFLILPQKPVAGKPIPWVWYAPTLPGLPATSEKWMFERFLKAGIAIAGVDVGESYGSPEGRAVYTALYDELVTKRGLDKQACLLARRLVERGVPFVTVNSKGWDTHQDLYSKLKERYPGDKWALLPSLDFALSGLISDLSDRGMLDETLVVVMGEFGRTPKLNANGGRDHWPRAFSVALAGGGVRGGQIIGQSDSLGESPKDRPVTPADLAATIYTLLGINPDLKLHTGDGRPVRVAPDGSKVVSELIA